MLQKYLSKLCQLAIVMALLPSCATIIGGSQYYAKVQVPNHNDAKIEYENTYKGTGEASFKVKRKAANNFAVTIKKEGCETQITTFTQRSFRGWAFTGSLIGWTGVVAGAGIPIPWGVLVDAATGAWWKPNLNEKGVSKEDFRHYTYQIEYTGCKGQIQNENPIVAKSKTDKLRDLKNLLDEGVLTEEEFLKEKSKILESEE